MTEEEKKKSHHKMFYIIIVILLLIIIVMSIGTVNITILDPQPFQNLTLNINIT